MNRGRCGASSDRLAPSHGRIWRHSLERRWTVKYDTRFEVEPSHRLPRACPGRARRLKFRCIRSRRKTGWPHPASGSGLIRQHHSPVAQLVEQAAVNRWVVGSSPTGGAFFNLRNSRRPTGLQQTPSVRAPGVLSFPPVYKGPPTFAVNACTRTLKGNRSRYCVEGKAKRESLSVQTNARRADSTICADRWRSTPQSLVVHAAGRIRMIGRWRRPW